MTERYRQTGFVILFNDKAGFEQEMRKNRQTKLKIMTAALLALILAMSGLVPVARIGSWYAAQQGVQAGRKHAAQSVQPGALTAYADEEELSEEEKARKELLEKTYAIEVASNKITGWPQGPGTYGEAACVMDMETGTILYDKKMNTKQYPASITKVMTAYVTCKYGDLNSQVKFYDEDLSFLEPGDAALGMHAGEVMTMKDAMHAMLLHSANEVSHAIIRTVGGQVRAKGEIQVEGAPEKASSDQELDYQWGIALMNMEAKAIGCTGSHFVNSYGLHDDNHYVTAHDMCVIAAAAYQYDYIKEVMQTLSYMIPCYRKDAETDAPRDDGLYTLEERWMKQNHKMLHPDHEFYYSCVTGGKTGFTDQAGTTLVTMAEKDGKKLACACLHTYGAVNVYEDTKALLEYGFNNFDHLTLTADDISKIANPKDPGEEDAGDGTALSSGKDDKKDAKKDKKDAAKSRGIGRKITMIDEEQLVVTLPKGKGVDSIVGKAGYNMADFDLNAGLLSFTYNDVPVGQIGIHFESFEASVKTALDRARQAWAERRAEGKD